VYNDTKHLQFWKQRRPSRTYAIGPACILSSSAALIFAGVARNHYGHRLVVIRRLLAACLDASYSLDNADVSNSIVARHFKAEAHPVLCVRLPLQTGDRSAR